VKQSLRLLALLILTALGEGGFAENKKTRPTNKTVEVEYGAGLLVTYRGHLISANVMDYVARELHQKIIDQKDFGCYILWTPFEVGNWSIRENLGKSIKTEEKEARIQVPTELKSVIEWRKKFLKVSALICQYEHETFESFSRKDKPAPSDVALKKILSSTSCSKQFEAVNALHQKCKSCENAHGKNPDLEPEMIAAHEQFNELKSCVFKSVLTAYPADDWKRFQKKYIVSENEYSP